MLSTEASDVALEQGQERPLCIGLSARLMHRVPDELGFRGKTLQYLEQSISHWVMEQSAVAFMVPALGSDAEVLRRKVSIRQMVEVLDGLLLQGGADVSPGIYGQQAQRPEWLGDPVRDRYEIELIEGFLAAGKPILGICRGAQLLNVAYGGTLIQDIASAKPEATVHVDDALYDKLYHAVVIEPDSGLSAIYNGANGGLVNSIHHQSVDRLGSDLMVEARSAEDGIVEAIRARGSQFVVGVQWHPEFHRLNPDLLDAKPLMTAFLTAAVAARYL